MFPQLVTPHMYGILIGSVLSVSLLIMSPLALQQDCGSRKEGFALTTSLASPQGFVFQQILTYYTGPRGKGRVERITTFSMSVACVALLGIDWWVSRNFVCEGR